MARCPYDPKHANVALFAGKSRESLTFLCLDFVFFSPPTLLSKNMPPHLFSFIGSTTVKSTLSRCETGWKHFQPSLLSYDQREERSNKWINCGWWVGHSNPVIILLHFNCFVKVHPELKFLPFYDATWFTLLLRWHFLIHETAAEFLRGKTVPADGNLLRLATQVWNKTASKETLCVPTLESSKCPEDLAVLD